MVLRTRYRAKNYRRSWFDRTFASIRPFPVMGGQMFNAVVRLCLSKMEPALRKVLRLEKEASERMKAKKLQKSKTWTACNREGPDSIEEQISLSFSLKMVFSA